MKYYIIQLLASLLVMGSFGGGFLVGAQYGKWAGFITFTVLATLGVLLHKAARKIGKSQCDGIDEK